MSIVSNLIADWTAARTELADLLAAEHPDVVDALGRTWTWIGRGDVYTHCGSAVPVAVIEHMRFPAQRVLNNPNYDLCDVCLNGRLRNVPDCDPSWNCSHTMHQR